MANVKNILPIVQSQKVLGQSVAYYPTIAKCFKSPETALFICQFIYWCDDFIDDECNISEWICKTSNEIYNSTGITESAQLTVRNKLKSLGVLGEKREGLPAKLHFQFNFGVVNQLLTEGIPNTRKQRKDIQTKDERGKFSSVPVNYRNKENGQDSVNSSSLKVQTTEAVNYGNCKPLNTETLYNKNLIKEDLKSEKEILQISTLAPDPDNEIDILTNNNQNVDALETKESEETPPVPPAPSFSDGRIVSKKRGQANVAIPSSYAAPVEKTGKLTEDEVIETLTTKYLDEANKNTLRKKLIRNGYMTEQTPLTFKQCQIIYEVYAEWVIEKGFTRNENEVFDMKFLRALDWMKEKNSIKTNILEPLKNNIAQPKQKPRY